MRSVNAGTVSTARHPWASAASMRLEPYAQPGSRSRAATFFASRTQTDPGAVVIPYPPLHPTKLSNGTEIDSIHPVAVTIRVCFQCSRGNGYLRRETGGGCNARTSSTETAHEYAPATASDVLCPSSMTTTEPFRLTPSASLVARCRSEGYGINIIWHW